MKKRLETADQLAQLALNFAADNELIPTSAAITYGNKSPHIRTLPYAQLALVGVPFTSAVAGRDLLATPHEIGHYVYWNSPGLAADLHSKLAAQPAWCSRWQEEIFADVFGCFVAGPIIGLDFQDILLDNSLERFVSDDGEHPVEAIRPYAYSFVLAELGFSRAADALNKRWAAQLQARNDPVSFIPFGGGAPVSLAEGRERLERFTRQILAYLIDTRGVRPGQYWSQDLSGGEELNQLYEQFDRWIGDSRSRTVLELLEKDDTVGVGVEGALVNKRRRGSTQTWIDDLKQQTGPLPPTAWLPVLSANGWTVKGPETPPGGGG